MLFKTPLHKLIPYVLLSVLFSTNALGADTITTQDITDGYKKHAALAQLHRWYLMYEEPKYGIENALDSLSEDISVKSGLGEAVGHEQYAERVKKLPTTWKNAHHVKSPVLTFNDDKSILLSTDITYQNQGLLENGVVRTAELTYTMSLTPSDTVLPKFTAIEIAQNSDGTTEEFVSRYAENRLSSLVHYWLALIEDPARNPEPVKEILADKFSLNFSSGTITDFDGFKAWLAGPGSQIKASTHVISNVSHKLTGDNEYTLTMDFDWAGILPNDTEMTAKTRHTWIVKDDVTERFARIQDVSVEVLEPFTSKKEK